MDDKWAKPLIDQVETFYHEHKKDKVKPNNWKFILLVKYLAHKSAVVGRLQTENDYLKARVEILEDRLVEFDPLDY